MGRIIHYVAMSIWQNPVPRGRKRKGGVLVSKIKNILINIYRKKSVLAKVRSGYSKSVVNSIRSRH